MSRRSYRAEKILSELGSYQPDIQPSGTNNPSSVNYHNAKPAVSLLSLSPG